MIEKLLELFDALVSKGRSRLQLIVEQSAAFLALVLIMTCVLSNAPRRKQFWSLKIYLWTEFDIASKILSQDDP